MPSVGQLSSTRRSFGPGEYAPTDDAWTSAGTPAAATASNTRVDPWTFVSQSLSRSRPGWISHARWTTASAPRKCGTRSSRTTSAAVHSTFGTRSSGSRRATPSTDSTAGSAASARTRLVPTLPVAPTTTTRISGGFHVGAGCDAELVDEREERVRVRRVRRPPPEVVPVDLLAQRARDLEDAVVVDLVLLQREQLRGKHVGRREHAHPGRLHLHLLGSLELLVGDGAARGLVDQVDHDVAVERLVEPALRRLLRTH